MIKIKTPDGLRQAEVNSLVSVVTETEHDGGQVDREGCVGILEKKEDIVFWVIQRTIDGKTNALGRVQYSFSRDGYRVIEWKTTPLDPETTPGYQEYERRLAEAGE